MPDLTSPLAITPAEYERLALLIEEASEVQKAAAKIMRHGWESRWPDARAKSNRDRLAIEVGHLQHALRLMLRAGDIVGGRVMASDRAKTDCIGEWLHFNKPAEPMASERPPAPGIVAQAERPGDHGGPVQAEPQAEHRAAEEA